jgi:Acetyltransferase (GNAT) domain/PilZ domain
VSLSSNISERRVYRRRRVTFPLYIGPEQTDLASALTLSESGLGFRGETSLIKSRTISLRFALPGSKTWVQTEGRIAWLDESRNEAGVDFVALPEVARSNVQAWILGDQASEQSGNQASRQRKGEKLAAVTETLSVREVHLDQGLGEIRERWKECNSRFPDHTLNCDPDWIQEHFKGDRVRIFMLRKGDLVVGVAPCRLHKKLECDLGFSIVRLPLRIAQTLDYPNMPAEESAFDMLFDHIVKSGVDAVYLQKLKAESFAWNYVRYSPLIRRQFAYYQSGPQKQHLLIRLEGSFESYINRFPAKTRKNRLREVRHLREKGDLRLIRTTKISEVNALVEAAHKIYQNSWQFCRDGHELIGRDLNAVSDELRFLAHRRWLRSYILKSGDSLCAFVLGHQYGGRFYAYAAGFDLAWRSYSVGTVIQFLILEDLFKENPPQLYDFGTPVLSKDYLANVSYPVADVWLFRRRPYARLAGSIFRERNAVSRRLATALDWLGLKSRVRRLLSR